MNNFDLYLITSSLQYIVEDLDESSAFYSNYKDLLYRLETILKGGKTSV